MYYVQDFKCMYKYTLVTCFLLISSEKGTGSNYTLMAVNVFLSSFEEVERKIRANDREYNLSFKYAVSIHVYLCIPSRYQQARGVSEYMKNLMDFIPYCFSDVPTLPLVLMESGLPYLKLEFQ